MAKHNGTTVSIPTQPATPGRIQSNRTWAPKKLRTPRREYSFMREYSHVWQLPPSSNFGPFDGGVQL